MIKKKITSVLSQPLFAQTKNCRFVTYESLMSRVATTTWQQHDQIKGYIFADEESFEQQPSTALRCTALHRRRNEITSQYDRSIVVCSDSTKFPSDACFPPRE